MHDGYRYTRNRHMGDNIHWRCAVYNHTKCKGRATTRVIEGYQMLRLNAPHSHPPMETFDAQYKIFKTTSSIPLRDMTQNQTIE